MRTELIKKHLDGEIFALRETELTALTDFLNNGAQSITGYEGAALDSINYEKIGRMGIISVDGAMAKKGYEGLCVSVFGYNDIIKAIDQAEADNEVDKIVFIVDSPGGAVAGVEQLAERVRWADKPTVTYYDNLGASAAIWAFIGADKVYASPTTLLGSIGVMALVTEEREDGSVVLTSRGAGNKVCADREECMAKIQSRLDRYETLFYQSVQTARPNFSPETIRSVFNEGDVIFADDAAWNGFIDDVISLKNLFEKEG